MPARRQPILQSVSETSSNPVAPNATATPQPTARDSYAVTAIADITDRSLHAAMARFTADVSPAALAYAYSDWATHLTYSPGKRLQLLDKAIRKGVRFANYAGRCAMQGGHGECCIDPLPQDKRFVDKDWQRWPYNLIYQGFLLQQQWWHNATTDIRGLSKRHQDIVEFATRQMLDMLSPSNFLLSNPEILQHTLRNGGMNLISGFQNLMEDWERAISGKKPAGTENFVVGRDVAATPGKVVYRNWLIELIQYAPARVSWLRSMPWAPLCRTKRCMRPVIVLAERCWPSRPRPWPGTAITGLVQ
jgi:polyhydroxyalkanoate synthase